MTMSCSDAGSAGGRSLEWHTHIGRLMFRILEQTVQVTQFWLSFIFAAVVFEATVDSVISCSLSTFSIGKCFLPAEWCHFKLFWNQLSR